MTDEGIETAVEELEESFENGMAVELGDSRLVWGRDEDDVDYDTCYVLDKSSAGTWMPDPWVAPIEWAAGVADTVYDDGDPVEERPVSELPRDSVTEQIDND